MMAEMQTLGLEIRRSMERVVGERRDRMDAITERLGLTGEQAERAKAIFKAAKDAETSGEDPRAARREAMRELAEILTPEQRATLRSDRPGGGRRTGGRAAPPAPIDD